MFFQLREEQARLGQRLEKEAIALTIQGRWEEAVTTNRSLIEKFPTDVRSYNRLGRALTELGELVQAKEAYSKALELAPTNAIAAKNLARLPSLSESKATMDSKHHKVTPELFVTETGKAGVVNLCNLAPSEVLVKMAISDKVHLRAEKRRLVIENKRDEYLGEVEPKHRSRLIKLIKGGNRYTAVIFSVEKDKMLAIIKEEYQHPSQTGHPSFPFKAKKRSLLEAKESPLRRSIIGEGGEATMEAEHAEEEAGNSTGESETSPEGFSTLEETDRGEVE